VQPSPKEFFMPFMPFMVSFFDKNQRAEATEPSRASLLHVISWTGLSVQPGPKEFFTSFMPFMVSFFDQKSACGQPVNLHVLHCSM
jgi:hypothetical protein